MNKKIKIAVDAMGGEDAPEKIINGINLSLKKNKDNYFFLFGDGEKINTALKNKKLVKPGDNVVISAGVPFGSAGTTNLLRLAEIIADKDLK